MKRTLVILGLAALVLAGGATAVLAQTPPAAPPGPGPGMGRGGGFPGPGAFKALQLTPQQKQQLLQLRANMIRKTAPLKAELAIKRGELWLLWSADQPNRGQILARMAEMDGLRARLREAHVDMRLSAMKVLTPAQREMFKHFGPMMHGMGGPGGGMGKFMRGRGFGRGMGMGGMGGMGVGGCGMGTGPGGMGMGPGASAGPEQAALAFDLGDEDLDL
jgi:Spy/CpxP family protein refolding chaperone